MRNKNNLGILTFFCHLFVFERAIERFQLYTKTGFLRCFRDPIQVPSIKNRVPRIRDNIIGSLESEKSGPYRSIPGT